MKKLILLSALCAMLTTATFGSEIKPMPGSDFGVIQNGPIVRVLYKAEKKCDVKITILDDKMHKVFTEVLKKTDNFGRPYDLSMLPQGKYTVEVSDASGVSRKSIVITDVKKNEKSFKVAKVFKAEGKVLLTVGRNAGHFEVKIRDEAGKVVYTEDKSLRKDFAKVYDISALEGMVTILVTDEHGNTENFNF